MRIIARSIVVPLLVATLIMIFMAPVVLAAPGAPGSGVNRDLAAVRKATVQYHDESEALADGYVAFTPHISGMGAHYFNFLLLMDGIFVPTEPEGLLYSLVEGDRPKLVAVEYIVFGPEPDGFAGDSDEWFFEPAMCHYADGHFEFAASPDLCTHNLDGHTTLEIWHPDLWTLHTWIWRGNPDGVFEEFNPNVP